MHDAIDTFTMERNGRTYDVAVYHDDTAFNPRDDYDHDATLFYARIGRNVVADELDGSAAGAALHHFIEEYGADVAPRYYGKWRAIAGSPAVLVTGTETGYCQGDYLEWFALVDTAVLKRDNYAGTAQEVAAAEADELAAYVFGDVFGVVVSLSGRELEDGALWGIVDRKGDYVRSVAADIADGEEAWLARESQKAGAGFIGVP